MNSSIDSFREKLENEYNWPALYTFKFIVPQSNAGEIKALFENHEVIEKPSSKGNYISVTSRVMAQSSDYIIDIYIKASKVEGVISL